MTIAASLETKHYPWQSRQWSMISSFVKNEQFPHALLLQGQEGMGKYHFAVKVASTWLCSQRDSNSEACGICQSCKLFKAGTHPDFFTLMPEKSGSALKVDQVRHFAEKIFLSGQYSDRRVVIVNPVESMTIEAANSFLKLLEEPPAGVVLLLLSSSPGQLLATLKSRCIKLSFPIPPFELTEEWVKAQTGKDASLAVSLGRGVPLLSLVINQGEPSQTNDRQALISDWVQLLEGQLSAIQVSDRWAKTPLPLITATIISYLADIIRMKLGISDNQVVNKDVAQALKLVSRQFEIQDLFHFRDKIVQLRVDGQVTKLNSATLFAQILNEMRSLIR